MIISDLNYLENTSEEVLGGFNSNGFATASGQATGASVLFLGVLPVPLFNLSSNALTQVNTSIDNSFSGAQSSASTSN